MIEKSSAEKVQMNRKIMKRTCGGNAGIFIRLTPRNVPSLLSAHDAAFYTVVIGGFF